MFHAYYDLGCSPPTFDVVSFLCEVERERLARAEEEVTIHIIPGPKNGFRDDGFWPFDAEERRKMLTNVVCPLVRMLPSASVEIDTDRPGEGFGLNESRYGLPYQVRACADGVRPLRATPPEAYSGPRREPYVTVTLREAEHWPQRNSRLSEWLKAASHFRECGYQVIFVRDTLNAIDEIPGESASPFAARSIACRGMLYSGAALNMGVASGPMSMALAMDVPTLMFRPTCEGLAPQFSASAFFNAGVPPGGQFPGMPKHQRLVWCEDTTEAIVAAFNAFMAGEDTAPRVTVLANTSVETMMEHTRLAMARGLPPVTPQSAHERDGVLIGGGPSLVDTLGDIRSRQRDGQQIFALNGTLGFLLDHGIEPDFQVILDPRAQNAGFIRPGRTRLLLASQCHPDVFDAAQGRDVGLWHHALPELRDEFQAEWSVMGAGTVGITALGLLFMIGYRKLHLYGYDSSDREDTTHAYEQTKTAAEGLKMIVWVGDQQFLTRPGMYMQATCFETYANLLSSLDCEITVHGDGLLPAIAHVMARQRQTQGEC